TREHLVHERKRSKGVRGRVGSSLEVSENDVLDVVVLNETRRKRRIGSAVEGANVRRARSDRRIVAPPESLVVGPAHNCRYPGVRRDARELAIGIAGGLEYDGFLSTARRSNPRVLGEPCNRQGVVSIPPLEGRPGVEREWALAHSQTLDRRRHGIEHSEEHGHGTHAQDQPRSHSGVPPPFRESGGADGEKRPGLVVELEDRVHTLKLVAVAVLEVDELAAGHHCEAEKQQEARVDLRGIVRIAQTGPGDACREITQKQENDESGNLLDERCKGRETERHGELEILAAALRLIFLRKRPEGGEHDGKENSPNGDELEQTRRHGRSREPMLLRVCPRQAKRLFV